MILLHKDPSGSRVFAAHDKSWEANATSHYAAAERQGNSDAMDAHRLWVRGACMLGSIMDFINIWVDNKVSMV